MMNRFARAGLLLLFGCASSGGGSTATPAGDALAYGMPAENPLTYVVADSGYFTMSMGGQNVEVSVDFEATMDLAFEQQNDALGATVRFLTLSGRFSNSMGQANAVGESDKPGPAKLRVAPDGSVTITEKPQISSALVQIFGGESGYHQLFTRLPARAISPGTEWVDTIRIDDVAESMTTQNEIIVHSRLGQDTVVGGRTLKRIHAETTSHIIVSGTVEGFEIRQELNGTGTALTLWDAARRTLVERVETGSATGTMAMPAMGMSGIPVSANSVQVIRLR